jgi:hypothetical protein
LRYFIDNRRALHHAENPESCNKRKTAEKPSASAVLYFIDSRRAFVVQ